MVSSEQLKVAFSWIDAIKELKKYRVRVTKVGKTLYITDDEFNRFLNSNPQYKKQWKKYKTDSRDLHIL